MSLQALVNGADCGPSTALQGLSKQFERDRGAQNDLFTRPGSSREAFRSPQAPISPEHAQAAAQFFARGAPPAQAPASLQPFTHEQQHQLNQAYGRNGIAPSVAASRPFDVHALREALPVPVQQQQHQRPAAVADWAADFLSVPGPSLNASGPASGTLRTLQPQTFSGVSVPAAPQRAYAATPPFQQLHHPQRPVALAPPPQLAGKGKARAVDHDGLWEREFTAIQHEQPASNIVDADELSRTAGVLLDAVRMDTSDKFAQSEFLGFMRQLRDRELVVDGDKVVERALSSQPGAESAEASRSQTETQRAPILRPGVTPIPQSAGLGIGIGVTLENRPGMASEITRDHQAVPEESALDRELAQDNADFTRYWADARAEMLAAPPAQRGSGWVDPVSGQWDALQREWDAFEATAAGVRPVSPGYVFQHDNPYLRGEGFAHRHHAMHGASPREHQAAAYASVLEHEAAVQRAPGDARAWYELGVRQQESDREPEAMRALRRAVELEPGLLPAWMALAVSYSNEARRADALGALQRWVQGRTGRAIAANVGELVDALLELVRATADAEEVDADVQIALAVLFHTTEQYSKALDCFRAALAARPHDALLYNRVGATLANSGRSDEALAYYRHALELSPAYVRAEFNTGIALVNMGRLEDGARHLMAALALQETETETSAPPPSSTSSGPMWDLLRSCLIRMNRMDLVTFCDSRNLAGIQAEFGAGDPMSA